MTQIPTPQHTVASAINEWHAANQEPPRGHMGVSQLGNEDERFLWLSFRWAFEQQFPGRILRLFRRGHNEEKTVVQDLQAIGCDVRDYGKSQRTINFGSHVSGSRDGVIMSGVPEAPRTPYLLEIKTISKSRFSQLCKNGLQKSNRTYWVQVHVYMYGTGLDRALFYAVCKDDDQIYTERVKLDKDLAEKYIERGKRIALSDRLPPPLTTNATDWRMKFSPYYAAYWPQSASTEHWDRLKVQRESTDPLLARICVNWRTDARSTPREDGTWYTERYQSVIPEDYQRQADESHTLHPDIMELAGWTMLDGPDENTARWRLPDGSEVLNGTPREGVYSSEELLADPYACAGTSNDKLAQDIRGTLGARVRGPLEYDNA